MSTPGCRRVRDGSGEGEGEVKFDSLSALKDGNHLSWKVKALAPSAASVQALKTRGSSAVNGCGFQSFCVSSIVDTLIP